MNEAMRKVVQKRNDLYGATVVANLQKRGFTAYYVPDKEAALAKALKLIPQIIQLLGAAASPLTRSVFWLRSRKNIAPSIGKRPKRRKKEQS